MRFRDAVLGRFVRRDYAKANPNTTVSESDVRVRLLLDRAMVLESTMLEVAEILHMDRITLATRRECARLLESVVADRSEVE